MIKFLLILYGIFLFPVSVSAQSNYTKSDSMMVVHQLEGFITAFKNLDFESFQSYFSNEVSAFFPPSALVSRRIDGKVNVMEVFRSFFARVKAVKSGPPYL